MEEQLELRNLIDRAKSLDREAFADLYDLYYDRVFKFVFFKIGNSADAEDLTSQIFLGALKSIDKFTWKGSTFASWLFRIANNSVADYYRGRYRSREDLVELDVEIVAPQDTEKAALTSIEMESVLHLMSDLPKEQHNVLILRFIAELSVAEVAISMDKTVSAIKSLQFRALENLRRLHGGELS